MKATCEKIDERAEDIEAIAFTGQMASFLVLPSIRKMLHTSYAHLMNAPILWHSR
jgi:sugar (pentulose or hexulose) kinase